MSGSSLRGTSFHILGGQKVLEAMLRSEGARPTGISKADFVIFMGGTDIDSELYGEQPHKKAQLPNIDRDRLEVAIYKATPSQFRIGICRGAQLLHVMNGGKLWQHVEHHLGNHPLMYETESGLKRNYDVSSTHHQMMQGPFKDGQVWAWANQTRKREFVNGRSFLVGDTHWSDPEVVAYKKTNTLCFQPHPEMMSPKTTRELFYRCLVRMVET